MREIRMLRSTWRGLETEPLRTPRQPSTLPERSWGPVTAPGLLDGRLDALGLGSSSDSLISERGDDDGAV